MSKALESSTPFSDVRELAMRDIAPDASCSEQVHNALLGMGRQGDFGKLGKAAEWLAGWQRRYPPRIENATLAVFAGSHGVTAIDGAVSLSSDENTKTRVEDLRAGRAPLSAIAAANQANIRIFELAIEQPTANFTDGAAMSERECAATIAYGFEALEGKPDLLALGVVGAGIGTAAAAVACGLYGGTPEYWVRPGPSTPKEISAARIETVNAGLARHRGHLDDPLEALRCLGGRELAACVGAILAARIQSVPVVLDGFATTIAAGIVHAMNPSAVEHVLAGHVTRRPAHQAALDRLDMTPLLPMEFNTGGGMGSVAAIGLLRTACAPFLGKPDQPGS
ncbi:nicotinate-nucleotide--dimethylbenzimidazole phosphoribosyltransferase [Henriciella algicola]|uniref:Nicotinate-nucleotide--dimethylbenzimidazole phosphoribosyltransferase n=1 Tax=Henriciella algicola TaxID=1608422 RepID=A0A399RCU0_9PROT|nr:nicotinate-nucleotide--dimethylbenzimidazole phosphoribosyltransferase [Henriciella algicola]RIJ27745.1 nicotinate-nucleotide--dimethylbenzimidazole phosphoribosyltransferase [Henriciella algicola]